VIRLRQVRQFGQLVGLPVSMLPLILPEQSATSDSGYRCRCEVATVTGPCQFGVRSGHGDGAGAAYLCLRLLHLHLVTKFVSDTHLAQLLSLKRCCIKQAVGGPM
jgi:hypothetical protein